MRTLPAAVTTGLASNYFTMAHLFALSVGTSYYRWTDFDKKINLNAIWYTPKGITFDQIDSSSDAVVETVSVEIDNADKAFSDIALANDLRGEQFWIYRVLLDSNLDAIGAATLLFLGYVDQMDIDRSKAKIEVCSIFIKWQTLIPRRVHAPTCPWIFNTAGGGAGVICSYGGAETWCDKTYERCKALSNTAQFGGFRWISDLADKEIIWGTKSKVFVAK